MMMKSFATRIGLCAALFGLIILGAMCWLVLDIGRDVANMTQQLDEQGGKVEALYNFVRQQVGYEEFEDYQVVSLELVREFRDPQFMSKAKFSPVDSIFGVVVGDGTVKLFDANTGDLRATLREQNELVTSLAFSPDGASLLTGTKSGKLFLWNLAGPTSRLVGRLGDTAVARLDWDGDGLTAAWSLETPRGEDRSRMRGGIVDIATGSKIMEFEAGFRDDYQGIAMSPDGRIVVTRDALGMERGACLFDASDGSVLKNLVHRQYPSGPLSVAIGPDSRTVAVGYAPDDVIVWDGDDGTVRWLFDDHSNWVVCLDFSKDGQRLASGAGDSTARVYDLLKGEEIGQVRFPGESIYVDSVGISFDRELLLAAIDGYVGIYKMP